MRTDHRNRARATGALEPGEQLRAAVRLLPAADIHPERVPSPTADGAGGRYVRAAGLDPRRRDHRFDLGGWGVVTDRRFLLLGPDRLWGRPDPGRVEVELPITEVRLNWLDLRAGTVPFRVVHLGLADGSWAVNQILMMRNLRRPPKHDEHELFVTAIPGATTVAPDGLATTG